MHKIIATDLDGTLIHPRSIFRFVPLRNLKFLRGFIDDGGKVILITSRGPRFAKNVAKQIKRPVSIFAYNSAMMIDNDKVVRHESFSKELVDRILEEYYKNYHKKGKALYVSTDHYGLVLDTKRTSLFPLVGTILHSKLHLWNSERIAISHKKLKHVLANDKITKIAVFNGLVKKKRKEGKILRDDFLAKFPEIEANWSDFITEFTPKTCDKAQGLKFFADYLNIPLTSFFVVGDSGNDIPMFKLFPHSFCMSRAPEGVKKHAEHVIDYVFNLKKYLDVLDQNVKPEANL